MDNIFTNLENSPIRQSSNNSMLFDFCKLSPIFNRFKHTDLSEHNEIVEKQRPRRIVRLEPEKNFDSDHISFQVSDSNFSETSSMYSKKMTLINHIDLKDMV